MLVVAALGLGLAMQLLQQGLLHLRGGQYEDARKELESATRSQPENAYAWAALAEACRRTNQPEEADRAADNAARFGSSQPAIEHALSLFYAAEGQFARAAKLEEQYSASPKADAQAAARAAALYKQAGDEASAERLSKADPGLAFEDAQTHLRKFDFSGAAEAVTAALAAHPENTQLVLTMGVARYGQRRFEEAIDDFIQVIHLDPTVPQPYEFLGRMLEQAGSQLPEIRQAFETWSAKNPQDGEAQLLLAKVRLSEDAKDKTAEDLIRRATVLDPKNWEAHYELGALLEAKRSFAEAAQELQRASELNPKEPMPHYHLARVYDRLGDLERAKMERQKHQELTSDEK